MHNVLAILIPVTIITFILGMISPAILNKLIKNEQKHLNRKRILLYFGGSIIILGFLAAVADPKTEVASKNDNAQTDQPAQSNSNAQQANNTVKAEPEKTTISYKITQTVTGKRYDGGIIYYVVIDPVDLSSEAFKNNIKDLTNKITKEKGGKISIEFFDSEVTSDVHYKEYVEMSLTPQETKDAQADMGIHYVASFSGELESGIYKNSLMFFPGTFKSNQTVGKYVDTIEYNPSK